ERGLREILDGLAPQAYWRQRTWRRVAVIFAGPATNALLALVLFTAVLAVVGGEATTTVEQVLGGHHPTHHIRVRSGDEIVAIDRRPVVASDIVKRISGSHGRPLTLTVIRQGRVLVLGPVRPRKENGVYRLGFVLRGAHLGVGQASWEAIKLTGVV